MAALSAAGQRAQALASLEAQPWDLVVIGGGISGAGVAQQAARRGWRVLLVERRDFAWAARFLRDLLGRRQGQLVGLAAHEIVKPVAAIQPGGDQQLVRS